MTDPQTLRGLAAKWRTEQKVFEEVHAKLQEEHGFSHEGIYVAGNNLRLCADELDALADAMEARLSNPRSEDEISSCESSDNRGDVANAETWRMEDWIRRELIGEKVRP